jgi:hypothetical protein
MPESNTSTAAISHKRSTAPPVGRPGSDQDTANGPLHARCVARGVLRKPWSPGPVSERDEVALVRLRDRAIIDELPQSAIEWFVSAGQLAGAFGTDEAGAVIFILDSSLGGSQ